MQAKSITPVEDKPVGWCVDRVRMARAFPEIRWESPGQGAFETISTELENRSSRLVLAPARYATLHALARQGWIRPMDAWFTAADMARYAPQAVELATVDGRLYGIPDDITPYVFFVRRATLRRLKIELPRTWAEFEEFAARLAAVEKKTLALLMGGSGLRMGFLLSLLGAGGIPLAGSAQDLLRDPGLLVSAFDWVRRLIHVHRALSAEKLTHPTSHPVSPREWREASAGFGWLSAFFDLPPAVLEQFIFTPFPRGPGLAPAMLPHSPLKGACWCMPWSRCAPEAAVSVLRSIHGRNARRLLRNAERFPFYALRECWDDPAIQRRYPLYRYAVELIDGTRPVLIDGGQGWFGRLDVTFRNALLDDLDGAGWAADLTYGVGDAALQRGKAPPIRLILSGIESRIGRVRGLNAIAREMGLRPDRLRRLFRREMGGEASVYLRKRRMDIARGLLAERSLSVKEIAKQVGYGNASSFCRAYLAFWGHPPSADRPKPGMRM